MIINITLSATKSSKPTFNDFFELLRVPVNKSDADREKILRLRISKLGEGKACSRCGGSGSYSYNPMDGSKCFQCKGSGYGALPKTAFTWDLYSKLKQKVENGALDAYFETQKELAKIDKAQDLPFAYSRKINESRLRLEHDWDKAKKGIQPDKDIHDLIYTPINKQTKLLDTTSIAISAIKGKLKGAKNKAEVEGLQREMIVLAKKLEEYYEEGLKLIEEKEEFRSKLETEWGKFNVY